VTDKHVDAHSIWKSLVELPVKLWGFCEPALAVLMPPRFFMPQVACQEPQRHRSEWELSESPPPVLPHRLHSERDPRSGRDHIEIAAHRDKLRASVLERVPPECREIYLLYYESELDISQIAAQLIVSEEHVKDVLAKANIAVARGPADPTAPPSSEPNR